jgi:hypothetical protein
VGQGDEVGEAESRCWNDIEISYICRRSFHHYSLPAQLLSKPCSNQQYPLSVKAQISTLSVPLLLSNPKPHLSHIHLPPPLPPLRAISKWPQTRRPILRPRAPLTLFISQGQFQHAALEEELMLYPIPCIRHAIQRRALDEIVLLIRGEVDVFNSGCLPCLAIRNAYRFEERRNNKVHVLASVREDTHHDERNERAHGAAIVIARYARDRVVEKARYVLVRALSAQRGAPGVVVKEKGEEGLFVTDVQDTRFVQPVEARDEGIAAAEGSNQASHVARREEGVQPHGAFVGFAAGGVEVAACEVQEWGAVDGVLVAKGSVHEAGLREADEACVGAIDDVGLGGVEHVLPVARALQVFVVVVFMAEGAGEEGNGEVVVGVFDRSGDATSFCTNAIGVEVLRGNVA